MAYRYRRRRYPRRRRQYTRTRRRYTRYARPTKSPYTKVHLVKRLGLPRLYNTPEPVDHLLNDGDSLNLAFNLANVSAYEDFTALYNEYKIRAVKVSFIPLANVSTMESSAYSNLIYSAIDINGEITSQPSRDQIRQYSGCRWSPYNRIHSRYFYPRPLVDGKTISGKQPWLSTANSIGSYYSLLVSPPVIPGIDSTEPIYKVECTYYLSFRTTK